MPQASNKPTRKVQAAGISGALVTVLVYGLSLAGIELPPEIAAAAVTLVAAGTAYLRTEE